mmetsp:Transcript_4639/g.13332  ORF Transcript_4639/g.13332 Transcript_4639/m.13332 type:complete len:208 (+) Transcript_4639:1249-1872(+)
MGNFRGAAIVVEPAMCAIWAEAGTHTRRRLAVAVGDEVVGVATCDALVGLEVRVAHHVVEVPLEQRHLGEGVDDVVTLGHGLVVGEHHVVHAVGHRGKNRLQGVVRRAPGVHQLISVDVQHPICPIGTRQLDTLLHVERLPHKQLVVARLVEERRQPRLVPRPAVLLLVRQLRRARHHPHPRQLPQLLHHIRLRCLAVHEQVEQRHP